MSNTRTLNSKTVNNSLSIQETNTIGTDPTITGGLSATINAGQQWRFDGTTGPAATKAWHSQVALSAGVLMLDLTALADAILTTVDMTGLKLKMLHLVAPSTNANVITVAPGAVNGYTGWVGSAGLILNPGDNVLLGPMNAGIAVDGTHKNLDLAGTGSQVLNIVALFGL